MTFTEFVGLAATPLLLLELPANLGSGVLMSGTVIVFLKCLPGSKADPAAVARVSFFQEEPRGLAELKRLSEAFREPELQSYTTT